jgi:hypothetical protein
MTTPTPGPMTPAEIETVLDGIRTWVSEDNLADAPASTAAVVMLFPDDDWQLCVALRRGVDLDALLPDIFLSVHRLLATGDTETEWHWHWEPTARSWCTGFGVVPTAMFEVPDDLSTLNGEDGT